MNVQQRYKWIHAITEIPDPCKILYNNQPLFAPLLKLTRHTGRSNLKNYPVSLHLGRVSFGEISRTRNVTRLTFLCYPYISSGSQVAFFPSTRPHCSLFTIPFSLSLFLSLVGYRSVSVVHFCNSSGRAFENLHTVHGMRDGCRSCHTGLMLSSLLSIYDRIVSLSLNDISDSRHLCAYLCSLRVYVYGSRHHLVETDQSRIEAEIRATFSAQFFPFPLFLHSFIRVYSFVPCRQ